MKIYPCRNRFVVYMVMLLLPFTVSAQWQLMESKASANISDLVFLDDGVHGWAAGTASAGPIAMRFIFRTLDGGDNWEEFSCPAYFRAMEFASPDSGWGVCGDGRIYRTLDGGENWSQQTSGTTRQLNGITFINNLEGWACGGWESGPYLVLHTSNGGETWDDQSFGSGYSCSGISFTDSQNGWISGHNDALDAHIHATEDGGVTWSPQTIPAEVLNGGIESIDFVNPQEGWAVTYSISNNGYIMHTSDGGDSWAIQYTTGLHYHSVDAKDADNAVVVGVAILSPSIERVYVTSDGGQSWSENTPPIWGYTEGPVYVGDDIWIASDETSILVSSDTGATWDWSERVPYWRTIDWTNSSTARVGSGSSAGLDSYGIISTDGGTSWVPEESAPGGTQYTFLNDNTGWMLWEGAPATLWRTVNGGADWTESSFGISSWIGRIFFTSPDSGWACGSGGTMRVSTNGGETWTAQNINTSNYAADLHFVDSSEGWVVGGYGGGNGFIRHTVDGGLNWTVQTPPVTNHLQHVYFLNSMDGWAAGLGGVVHRTVDGGITWNSAGGIPYDPKAILMVSSTVGWIAGGRSYDQGGQGYIYKTENGGDSWDLEWTAPWPKQQIVSFALQDDNTIWGVGYHSTILRRDFVLGIEGGTTDIEAATVSVSPNPFQGSAMVSIGLESAGFVELDVFDLSGRMVRTLAEEQTDAGLHSYTLDAEGLAPGVYLVRFRADGQCSTAQCILLR